MKEMNILVNGKSYKVEVGDLSSSPAEVIVDGKPFQVEFEAVETVGTPVRTAPVKKASAPVAPVAVAPASPVVAATGNGVRAPMPGTIVRIEVHAGDKVTRGQTLLSLEAMKMKNAIKSPVDAVVKAIHVNDGQKVQFNDLLVSFE